MKEKRKFEMPHTYVIIFAIIVVAVNMFIAFAPVMVMMSLALGLDSLTGAAIIILGGAIGFSTGTLNASTTLTSQQIAELPPFSGLARGIGSIMADGTIIDTVVHSMAAMLDRIPFYIQGPGMLIANIIVSLFISSGSGQASVTMPIMIPLADLLGVTRQTAVLAFNFGDGFVNYILPTSGALMGILGAVNIPYDRWVRFMWKCFAMWTVVGCIMVIIAQVMKYGPM